MEWTAVVVVAALGLSGGGGGQAVWWRRWWSSPGGGGGGNPNSLSDYTGAGETGALFKAINSIENLKDPELVSPP